MTKLRDICRFQSGGTPSRGTPAYFNGNVPWITTVALNGDVIDGNQAIEWITGEAIAKSAAKIVPPHSVMVGTRVGIGKVAINSVPMSTSQDIISLIGIDENKWDKKFICHLITANKEHLTSQARGATIKGIKIEAIADLVLPEISLTEQARISEVIGKVDALMHMHQQMAMNLEQLIKSRFIELFGDPETNPKGWTRQRLDQICENLDSRRVPITSTNRKAGNYPYYGASGIVDYVKDYIFDEDILLISEDGANLVMRSTPIAFSVSGKVWVNNHAHVVRFESKATQKYIEICFALTDISGSITGTAQPKLNQAKLNAMMFCVPPIELQEQFATFVKQTDKSKLCGTMEVAA
jgi:restriction endonuclease S subunit